MAKNQQTQRNVKQLKEAWDGLDFIMELFPVPRVPRNILTGVSKGQRIVRSRDNAMMYYEAALYEDCYINAYLNYEEMAKNGQLPPDPGFKPVPNHIIIDLDRKDFSSDEELESALADTLQNIKNNFTGNIADSPVIVWSGNGYHVHVSLPGWTTPLEDMPEFAAFKDDEDLPDKFLRWAEDVLSNDKADKDHNPSIKSALFRVPGTFNSKAKSAGKDPRVRLVQGIEYTVSKIVDEQGLPDVMYEQKASRPTQKFFNDFQGYLIQELIDDKVEKMQRRKYSKLIHVGGGNNNSTNSSIAWIDSLLQTGVADERKNLIYWVLAPYLINVKEMDHDDAYHIIESWLEKCDEIKSLDPSWDSFRYRMRYCLNAAEEQERKPIRFETFKEFYPDIYRELGLGEGGNKE
jgi:Primase X